MAQLDYILADEGMVGKDHGEFADTLNRALRQVLTSSGYDPDADFPGLLLPGLDVKAKGALGDGANDDTAAIHAARDAAGVNRTIVFSPGTYLVTGLTASVAGQRWHLMQGAVIKLKNAQNVNVVNITAAGVQLVGPGTIDGNRANNTTEFISNGVEVKNGAHGCRIGEGLTIQSCRAAGVWMALTAGQTIAGLEIRQLVLSGNGKTSANQAQLYLSVNGAGATLTDLVLHDITADGWVQHNGCIKIAAQNGAAVRNISFDRLLLKVGAAVADVDDTLGLEFFAVSSSLFDGIVGGTVMILGETTTNTKCFAFSLGGESSALDTNGCKNIAIDQIVVRDCRETGIEILASQVSIGRIATYNSGRCHIDATNNVGGLHDIAIGEYVNVNCVDPNYSFHIGGNAANGVTRVAVKNLIIRNAVACGVQLGVSGVNIPLSHIHISNYIATGLTGPAVVVGGALTDSSINGMDADITGTAGANTDVIILNNTNIARVRFNDMRLKGATRNGFFANTTVTDVDVRRAYITGCAADGIKTTGGTGWVIDDNECVGNTGTGIILAGAPGVKSLQNNLATGNTTAQINKGSATFRQTPRGNSISSGASSGRAVLVAGTVTVNTAEVLASDSIALNRVLTGGTQGTLSVGTIVAGTSFVINSSNAADTSTIFWEITH